MKVDIIHANSIVRQLSDNKWHNITELATSLHTDINHILRLVHKLIGLSIPITIKDNKIAIISRIFPLKLMCSTIEFMQSKVEVIQLLSIDSTQKYAKRLLDAGKQPAFMVISDMQYSGIGRNNKVWKSQFAVNSYFTICLCMSVDKLQALSLVMGIAVYRTVKHYVSNSQVQLKWPNDVYIDGVKVAGVLVESSIQDKRVQVLIGIGLNVNDDSTEFMSIYKATGGFVDRQEIMYKLLSNMEDILQEHIQYGFKHFVDEFNSNHILNCEQVEIIKQDNKCIASVMQVTSKGVLRAKINDTVKEFIVGEVSIKVNSNK